MRLIDADVLLEAVSKWLLDEKDGDDTFIDLISNAPTVQREGWVSVGDRLPKYKEGKEYSENVLGIYKGYKDQNCLSIFNLSIVEITEEGHKCAWARLSQCFGDLREADCEWDDDYEVTHWMPLPDAPKLLENQNDNR